MFVDSYLLTHNSIRFISFILPFLLFFFPKEMKHTNQEKEKKIGDIFLYVTKVKLKRLYKKNLYLLLLLMGTVHIENENKKWFMESIEVFGWM